MENGGRPSTTSLGDAEMTSDEPADSSQGGVDMRMVWQLLTDEEQREFWKFAGKHARDLNHGTATFRRLCAALRDAEAGKTGGRSTNGLPGSVRPLSSDELQRSIGKVKSRLLEQPNAEPFLIGAFCVWIQDSCLAVLNAVLDTVKCPRDERGTLRGSIPDFSGVSEILCVRRFSELDGG